MADSKQVIPPRNEFLYKGFAWYANRMVRKSFEAMALDDAEYQRIVVPDDIPIVVYANHPSWWDPILAVLLHEYHFAKRAFYAPIDAEALKKYEILRKLGFYPTQMNNHRGAASFLRTSKAILHSKKSVIWLTPEGHFSDPRDRGKPLMPGLAHIASNEKEVALISLAIEYPFLNERKPYMMMRLSEPIFASSISASGKLELSELLQEQLRTNQDRLAQHVLARDLKPFRMIQQTIRRPNNVYDVARVVKSVFKRQRVQLRHDNQ